jgi:predicted DNA-binding transcriptional regulator AlpA
MTPIVPDLEQLAQGRLVPLEEAQPEYRSVRLQLARHGLRLADDATWREWRRFRWVELRQAVALQLYLDPETVSSNLGARWQPNVTFGALFGQRLRLAVKHALHESLQCLELAEDFTRAKVTMWAFASWADALNIPCPPQFPRVDPKPPVAAKPRKSRGEPGFLRQSDLIGLVVPFSAATLWRKVKKGTFPTPIKISEGVTAWRQENVQAWLAERAEVGTRKKTKRR